MPRGDFSESIPAQVVHGQKVRSIWLREEYAWRRMAEFLKKITSVRPELMRAAALHIKHLYSYQVSLRGGIFLR
jgi:hypothetical protein